MASWQRYPGAWSPREEEDGRHTGRDGASAPPLRFQEDEEKKEDASDGRSQRYYSNIPPSPFPGYPPVPPQQGFAAYPSGVQERQDRYNPGYQHQSQYTYPGQAPRLAPVQQSTARGQWVPLEQQQLPSLWVPGPERSRVWSGAPSPPRRPSGFLVATLRLCMFHVMDVFFALVASGVLSAGLCAAASLIPVCCVGLLLFQVLVYIVFALAQWDVTLANYIAPAHECAYASVLPPGRYVGREGLSGYRITPGLAFFSPLSLMAMLYFVLVKPVIGALSFLSLLLVIAPTVSFVTALTSHYHGRGGYNYDSIQIYGVGPTSMSRYPGLSLVGAISVTLVGVALMQLVAKISQGATRFFCCEKFAVTARFAPYQFQPLNHGAASYGATSTRSYAS
jgi:hypothetical protein